MKWNFDNERPIYLQLVEQLKIFIVLGLYPSGERLPSVRDLSLETQVNPNTMQKALTDLENMGLIRTIRTSGKFVTDDSHLLDQMKEKLASEKVDFYFSEMAKLNYNKEKAIAYLKKHKEGGTL